jgi:hypothetical protein
MKMKNRRCKESSNEVNHMRSLGENIARMRTADEKDNYEVVQ